MKKTYSGIGCVALTIAIIVELVLNNAKGKSKGCGIPVFEWLQIHIMLSLSLIPIVAVGLCFCSWSIRAFASWALFFVWAIMGCMVYNLGRGWFMWFSVANDCNKNPDTHVA
jgi:hypothetical protein